MDTRPIQPWSQSTYEPRLLKNLAEALEFAKTPGPALHPHVTLDQDLCRGLLRTSQKCLHLPWNDARFPMEGLRVPRGILLSYIAEGHAQWIVYVALVLTEQVQSLSLGTPDTAAAPRPDSSADTPPSGPR